jgi:hypothetical protein
MVYMTTFALGKSSTYPAEEASRVLIYEFSSVTSLEA